MTTDSSTVPGHDCRAALDERTTLLGDGILGKAWRRLAEMQVEGSGPVLDAFRAEVLANALAVIAFADDGDLARLDALVGRHGHQRVARAQTEIDAVLRSAPGLPLTTALCRSLARAGRDRAVCWLLVADLPDQPAGVPTTPADVRRLVEDGGIVGWRDALAVAAANPWGPEVSGLAELAQAAGLPEVRALVEWTAELYRERHEEAERLEVAQEIRRLVAISGCSQRQFARYVGTSPSRLSTYVNGLVTPSAAMMVRINRSAAALAQGESVTGGLQT